MARLYDNHDSIEYMRLVRAHWDALSDYKEFVANEEYVKAYNIWLDIPFNEASYLSTLAPSNGGVLTTEERDLMKSNKWSDARKELFEAY